MDVAGAYATRKLMIGHSLDGVGMDEHVDTMNVRHLKSSDDEVAFSLSIKLADVDEEDNSGGSSVVEDDTSGGSPVPNILSLTALMIAIIFLE